MLPDNLERTRRELELQIALRAPLIATKGWVATELGAAYERALELCRKIGETPELFQVLHGLCAFCVVRAEHKKGRQLAEQLYNRAQGAGDPALLLHAHELFGIGSFWLGEPTIARKHLDQAIALYDSEGHRSHAFVYGTDPGVMCLTYAAVTLWHLGYPDQALKRKDEAVALARKVAHPFSLAWALNFAAWIHEFRREWPMAEEHAEATVALSAEQGFTHFLDEGTFHRGHALAGQGRTDEGIAGMRDALAATPRYGRELGRPVFLAWLAAASGSAGRTGDSFALVAEALALVEKCDERHWEAEIHRLKGELLLESGGFSEAESCFRGAIEIACLQQAKSLELRSVTSLSRLLQKQGQNDEARRMLVEIYGWFSEGFDTADLKDAKALLEELS